MFGTTIQERAKSFANVIEAMNPISSMLRNLVLFLKEIATLPESVEASLKAECVLPSSFDPTGQEFFRMQDFFCKVEAERARQHEKWGEQNHPLFLDESLLKQITNSRNHYYGVVSEESARESCKRSFEHGKGTWFDAFIEEVAESVNVETVEDLETELIQVAAMCCAMIDFTKRHNLKGKEGLTISKK